MWRARRHRTRQTVTAAQGNWGSECFTVATVGAIAHQSGSGCQWTPRLDGARAMGLTFSRPARRRKRATRRPTRLGHCGDRASAGASRVPWREARSCVSYTPGPELCYAGCLHCLCCTPRPPSESVAACVAEPVGGTRSGRCVGCWVLRRAFVGAHARANCRVHFAVVCLRRWLGPILR